MRAVALLAELNTIDQAIDTVNTRLAQINEALREPESLRAARADLAAAEAALARWEAAQADREKAQADASARLARTESKLYGGKIKDPKELGDLQRDQDQLRRQRSQVEDELLEALMAVETESAAVEERRAALGRLAAAWEAEQSKLRAEKARLQAQLPGQQARQAAARKGVPQQYLSVYDSLRIRRAGRAVAELDGDECSICNVAVSPNKVEAARYGDQLVYCDNCGRLLWGE